MRYDERLAAAQGIYAAGLARVASSSDLIGATAKVTGKRRTKLEIQFEQTRRRYFAGMTVIIPSSCVEIIGD
jgi:hypothetical protein